MSASGLCPECLRTIDSPIPTPKDHPQVLGDPTATAPPEPAPPAPEPVSSTRSYDVRREPPTASATEANGSRVPLPTAPPGFELIRELGIGGMGAVYLAREAAPERLVAMKFLNRPGHQGAYNRFLIEVRALATLDHPNIVRVLSTDFLRSEPYFTTEYAPGGSLLARVEADGPFDPREAARILAIVARAVHAAHACDIIHRDLKPSNIVLAADGMPKVSDFGLAKRLDRDDGLTTITGPLGSPPYMAPEQTSRSIGEADARTDVYGLGATLYHLVTGQRPFGGMVDEVIRQVQTEPPIAPRSLCREVPPDLEAIILKCLEKDPARRYQTAEELAVDLDKFRAGDRNINAPLLTRWRRLGQWAHRYRKRIAAVGASLLVIAGLTGVVLAIVLPEDPLKKIHKEIAAGRSVTLVGEDGTMNYPYQWSLGPTALLRARNGAEVCTFESIHNALLELVPDPGTDRYEVMAQIQITAPLRDADIDPVRSETDRVGLYFGYDRRAGAGGQVAHTMFAVSSNDYRTPGHPLERTARLETLLFIEAPDVLHTRDSSHFMYIGYEGVNTLPGQVRTINIRVTPDEVRAYWDGQEFAAVSTATIRQKYAKIQGKLDSRMPGTGILVGDWSPRMPLGIHCHECSVRIQNVVLKPLPPPKN